MASVDFAKQKSAVSAKAVFRHCASDTREKSKHKNQQIDTSKTKENFSVKVTDYKSICKAYDERMKEVEKTNTNKRKDRVTLLTLEYAIPDEIPYEKHEEYVKKVNEIVESMYGKENTLGWYVHRDEIHDYTDKDGQRRTSKNHVHGFVVPELNGQLNAKQCSSRKNMVSLNNAIDDMTKLNYGCPFKVGGKKNNKTVEELKEESALIEKLQAENRALRAENERLRAMIQPKAEKSVEVRKEPVKAKESPVEAYKRSKEHTERYGRTIKEEPVEVVGVSERTYGSSAMDDVVAHYMSLAKAKGTNDKPKAEKPVKTQNTASQKESLLSQTLGELGRVNRGSNLEDIEEKINRNGKKDKDDYGFGF